MELQLHTTDGTRVDQDLPNADFAIMSFSRRNVEAGLIGDALDRLLSISDSPAFVAKFADNMSFLFEGYGSDSREIYEIPACRKFFRDLTKAWPYWFHFLDKQSTEFTFLFCLLCDVEVVARGRGATGCEFTHSEQLGALALELFEGMNRLYEAHGIPEDQNIAMSDKIIAAFNHLLDC